MRRLYIALVCTQALHSTEEIITGFYRRTPEIGARIQTVIPSFPLLSMSATVFILLNTALVAVLAASVLLVYRGTRWARCIITTVAIVEFFNGAAHMTAAAVSGGYFPGAASGVVLFILSILVLRSTLRQAPIGVPRS
jgi:hypothetical protein